MNDVINLQKDVVNVFMEILEDCEEQDIKAHVALSTFFSALGIVSCTRKGKDFTLQQLALLADDVEAIDDSKVETILSKLAEDRTDKAN